MAVSKVYIFLWGAGIVFVILPHLNLGLLSDYKICADSECASLMSRVQAIRDHRGKDCRFLSFKRGESIFVYHKLTGKREDLWAGSIDQEFGHFPKDAVVEEQVYVTSEKIVETQESDFFCMDESGYIIDSSHLDPDYEGDDSDQIIQIQESETTQTSPNTDDTNAGSPSTPEDVSTESPPPAQQSEGASAGENEEKNDGDEGARTDEEEPETPAAPNEQGGSPSSSWLSSSMTGWLGLGEEEEAGNVAEEEKKDEIEETQAEGSYTSSMMGWVGLGGGGGGGKPDDAEESSNSPEEDGETADSFTSTMTGWLGYGSDKKTEQEHDEEVETDEEEEQAEKFRSRKLSLDLEANQLQVEEEKEEMGTLGWLGSGLSSTLGFGLTNQESEEGGEAEEVSQKEEEQPASSSWLDLGITDMLGFGNDENEENEETEEDETLKEPTGSQNVVDTSQSQPAPTDEAKTEPSLERLEEEEKVATKTEPVLETETREKTTETQLDQNLPSETGSTASVDVDSDGKLEEKSQSMLDSSSQTGSEEEEEILDDNANETDVAGEVKKKEMEGEDHQVPESVGNEDEVNSKEPGEEIQTAIDLDQDFVPQNDISSGSVFSSDDLKSAGQSVSEAQEVKNDDKTESVKEEEAEVRQQIDNTEESNEMSLETGASSDDHKAEGSSKETDVLHQEIPTTLSDESTEHSRVSGGAEESSGENLPSLSPDTAEEKNEPEPIQDDSLTTDHLDTPAITDNNTEAETHHDALGQEFDSSHTANESAEMHEQALEEDTGTFSSHESTTNQDTSMDNIHLSSVSPPMQTMATKSEDKLKEMENNLQTAEAEKEILDSEKDFMKERDQKSEREVETEEEPKGEEERLKIEELKEGETQEELKEVEEIKEEEKMNELKENEKQEGIEELKEEEKKVEDLEKEKQEEIEELKEEVKLEELKKVEEMKKEEKQEELKEVEEMKKAEKQEELKEVEEMKKEEKHEELKEVEETMKEEKQEELKKMEEMKKEEKQEELKKMEEMKKEEKQEIAEELKQEAVDELKRDEKQHEVEELKKDEKQEGVEELKGVMKQEEVGGLSEGVKQQEVEEIKEEKKKEVVEEVLKEDEKKEEVEEKNQEQVEELKEEVKPVEELRKEEKQQNVEEIMEEKKEEVMDSKEEDKQEQVELELEELKEEEKQLKVEEVKKEKKEEVIEAKEEETQEVDELKEEMKPVEELREEEKQHKVEEEKKDEVVEELKKEEKQEELKEKEMHDQNDTGNEKETQDSESVFSETAEKTEQSPTESFQAEEEKREAELQIEEKQEAVEEIKEEERREVEVKQQAEDVEEETRSKEEDSGQILSTRTEESERISFKREEDRIQEEEQMKHEMEEKRKDNDKADVKEKEQEEVDQKGEIEQTDNEVPHSIPNESLDHLAGDSSTTEKIPEIHSEDHNGGVAEDESGGAFGLFKNAFGLFGETPGAEIKESTEPTPSLDTNTGETSQPEASLTPEQDSTIATSQVYTEDTVIQPSSPSLTQTQTPSHPSSPSPNTEAPLKPKTHSKHYKTLLVHMSADDMAILEELFGRHKLQFLDFILGGSEVVTKDPESESILFDIETLLNHHMEMLTDAPQEDKEKTRTLIALQKLQMLLERVRQAFNTGDESRKTGDSSISLHDSIRRDEGMKEKKERDGEMSGGTGKQKESEKRGGKEERVSTEETGDEASQPGSLQQLGEVMKQILDFAHQTVEDSSTHARAVAELLIWLSVQVVSSLPDDIRPGPDLYGVPWEPVIFSSLVGLLTMLLFSCRCYSSVKSRLYRSKERWMAEQFSQLLDEKCKVLETLSKCQQEYDELETSLRDSGVLAQTQKTEHLEVKATQLEHAKKELERDLDQLKDQLDQQKEHRIEQEKRIAALEESMKTCEEEAKNLQSLEEQAQTTLKVYSMNSDRLQRNLETAGEENALLQESNAQLQQQVEGWAERVSELEEEMRRCEAAHNGMMQDVANKDERIMSLTDRLLRMKAWDSDLEEERGEEGGEETSNGTPEKGEENGKGDDSQSHLQKVQKLIYAAKLNADLKSVDEDKDRVFAKLNDEVKAKEELEGSIKELEDEQLSLQSDSEHYTDQVQRLQQKLNIMTEMYQENELKLHRLLTVEEKERLQKEEKLNKADKNIALAMEELQNYRRRAEEMEEELEKTKQSYQTQISAHEKKAHNNWLAARAADRELSDIRRENALFRQKLTDTQFKLDALDKDPYALDSLARPLPFRAERSPYGPSPLGRPASETRAFLSPPTLMEGPPARLSPRVEPPGGQGEMERSGGPHSDSGSISPTWERDRRGHMPGPPGPLGPPGYMFPEPGGPMYRRPVPPPGAMGILPPPGSLPLGPPLPHPRGHPLGGPPSRPHPADMADGPYRENSLGPGEQDPRESGPSDRRTPPEADPRMGGAPPPGPPMGPMDGPFPRRAPYGPPDFYPPRGPGGPPMMPMWAPPPPGMMFPPRFPPGGPPHPHMPSYGPPMRAPPPDGLPPPSMGPPPTQSQSPEEHTPSPQDMI